MKTFSQQQAQQDLISVLDEIKPDKPIRISATGGNVVVMSQSDFNSWRETLHLLGSPANAKHLLDSIESLRNATTAPQQPHS